MDRLHILAQVGGAETSVRKARELSRHGVQAFANGGLREDTITRNPEIDEFVFGSCYDLVSDSLCA